MTGNEVRAVGAEGENREVHAAISRRYIREIRVLKDAGGKVLFDVEEDSASLVADKKLVDVLGVELNRDDHFNLPVFGMVWLRTLRKRLLLLFDCLLLFTLDLTPLGHEIRYLVVSHGTPTNIKGINLAIVKTEEKPVGTNAWLDASDDTAEEVIAEKAT